MEDFEKEDFEALRTYLTVYPDSALVNINTAKPMAQRLNLAIPPLGYPLVQRLIVKQAGWNGRLISHNMVLTVYP